MWSRSHKRLLAKPLFALLLCTVSVHSQKTANKSPASGQTLPLGSYYALVIGNNNYRHIGKLKTAINDATALKKLLEHPFEFQVTLLKNATREDIFASLQKYENQLPENSNLLIYYAGHGYHDRGTDVAYWLPVDAEVNNRSRWISASDITSHIKAMRSKHVLIVSDSCYSGALTSGPDISIDSGPAYLAKMFMSRSRNLMSSGGDEPVNDSGASGHSVFANAILNGLKEVKEKQFTAADIFQQFIKQSVVGSAAQVPQYSYIDKSEHDFGDFVFSQGLRVIVISDHPSRCTAPKSLPGIGCKKRLIVDGVSPKIKAGDSVPCDLLDQPLRWIKEYPLPQLSADCLTKWMLTVTVDENGRVIDIKPRGGPSPQGMETVIKAEAGSWQTNPPTYQGKGVKSSFALDIEFGP